MLLLGCVLARVLDPPPVAAEHAKFASQATYLGTDAETMAAISKMMQPCTGRTEPRLLAALERDHGAALVIGANTGAVFSDPSFAALNSSVCAHIDKIYVEPIPSLFRALERNLRHMSHARAVQAAVTDRATATSTLPMYCLFDPSGDFEIKTKSLYTRTDDTIAGTTIPSRRRKEWWNQVCTLDPARLIGGSAHDLQRDLGVRGAGELRAIMRNVSVPALTVQRLLETYVRTPVRFVQIDVEGADDRVVNMLPLGQQVRRSGVFCPSLITFEWIVVGKERLAPAVERLRAAGYALCRDGQNVRAQRVGPRCVV